MKLFIVLLLAYGARASKASLSTSVSLAFPGFPKCLGLFGSSCGESSSVVWYWKIFNGTIPQDAVDASDCKNPSSLGNLFIGQGFVQNVGLLPGSLYPGLCLIHVQARKRVQTLIHNILILCAKPDIKFQWIEVNILEIEAFKQISGIKLIDGGYEFFLGVKVKTYIGRHIVNGKMEVGKVCPVKGLSIISKTGRIRTFQSFEILVYIPSQCQESKKEPDCSDNKCQEGEM